LVVFELLKDLTYLSILAKEDFMTFYYYALLAIFVMIMPCLFFVNSIVSYCRHSTKLVKK